MIGPEHGRVFREAGWDRARVTDSPARSAARPGEFVRGAGGIAEGMKPRFVSDPAAAVPKFAAPDRILLAYAGGDAGLFSMVYGGWVAGEIGSAPVVRERRAVAVTILDPTREADPSGRPLATTRLVADRPATIALLDIRKPRGDVFLDELEKLVAARGHTVIRTAKPTFTKPAPLDLRAEIATRCDAVIEALAD